MSVTQSEPYLAGMFAELRCSVIITSNAVDTPINVAVVWQKNGMEQDETDRVRILQPHLVGGLRYDGVLQFSTLSTTDSGNYMCISTISPAENGIYITNLTETASFSFTISGNYDYVP